jgi:MFS family permease
MVCHGFVHNYAGLLACRLVLGIPEAGIFPACSYYVTMWYPRAEAQYRTALFYGAASLAYVSTALQSGLRNIADNSHSGAFSGLLAYCISLMDGVGGYAGWQWIFILEGLATVVAGMAAWFFIHDSPNGAKWLDQEEKDYINSQLAYDGNSAGNALQEGKKKSFYIKEAFSDWQVCSDLSHRCLPSGLTLPRFTSAP